MRKSKFEIRLRNKLANWLGNIAEKLDDLKDKLKVCERCGNSYSDYCDDNF